RQAAGSLLLGAIHALSFAPGPLPAWSLPFIQIFSLAFLAFYVFQAATVRQAALNAFLFGIANFALGFYWLFISMHEYGGMAAPLAGAAVLLLATVEALFIVAAATLSRWLSARHLR